MTDLEPMFEMRSDPRQLRYLQRPIQNSMEETKQWLTQVLVDESNGSGISWAIRRNEGEILLGSIGFYRSKWEHYRTEIGYMLRLDYQGQGIMRECVPALCSWAFEHWGVHSIEANIHPENQASRKVLLNAGFKKEAYFRENYFFEGHFYDSEIYGLLSNDLKMHQPKIM